MIQAGVSAPGPGQASGPAVDRLPFDPWVEVLSRADSPDFESALGRLWKEPGLAALDSAGGRPARFDLLAFDPPAVLEGLDSVSAIAPAVQRLEPAVWLPGPFQGGFIGALAYDLGIAGECQNLPQAALALPSIVGGLYTDWILFSRVLGSVVCVWNRARSDWRERRERVLAALADPHSLPPEARVGALRRETPAEVHRSRLVQLIEQIADGELYQANLAHAFQAEAEGHPLALYLRLRRHNPAPFAAYLDFPGGALLSSSPELLVDFDGRKARTRPIKGTSARCLDPELDRQSAQALLSSIKDRAELTMIVDLARNDLGRVSEIGSVRVKAFPELESYAAVHHLVAEVEAWPLPAAGAGGLLAALFPGASITGAPKLAAMQAIARFEGRGRGFFCGSLGFLDRRGRALFNILIRTLVWHRPPGTGSARLEFQVGGGITIRSDPDAEELETLDKARALIRALEASR